MLEQFVAVRPAVHRYCEIRVYEVLINHNLAVKFELNAHALRISTLQRQL